MLQSPRFAVIVGTIYVLTYCVFLTIPAQLETARLMVFVFPFIILWVTYSILRFGKYEEDEADGRLSDDDRIFHNFYVDGPDQ